MISKFLSGRLGAFRQRSLGVGGKLGPSPGVFIEVETCEAELLFRAREPSKHGKPLWHFLAHGPTVRGLPEISVQRSACRPSFRPSGILHRAPAHARVRAQAPNRNRASHSRAHARVQARKAARPLTGRIRVCWCGARGAAVPTGSCGPRSSVQDLDGQGAARVDRADEGCCAPSRPRKRHQRRDAARRTRPI